MPKHKNMPESSSSTESTPKMSKEEQRIANARKFLFEDKNINTIVRLLKESAESGNPVARTMYGIYHVFVGSNIPEEQDAAYAEAIKWFYMNRKGSLERQMLSEITGQMSPSCQTDIYRQACNIASITQEKPVVSYSAEELARILSVPLSLLNISRDTTEELENKDYYTIGSLLLDDQWRESINSDDDFSMLDVAVDYFAPYFAAANSDVKQIIRRLNKQMY